jgi:perosamine synthetase
MNAVLAAIRHVVGERRAALHEPRFAGNEWVYLKECLASTFVSSVGPFVDRFEAELANYTGARHVVAVVNGTAGLHVALQLAGVRPGDEVLVPTLSFAATANAVIYCGAVPHFVDSATGTLGIDPGRLREYLLTTTARRAGQWINTRTGRVIRAVVPMHTFGHPVEMDEILAIGRDFDIAVVEDAAEAVGSYYNGRHAGTMGLVGVLSFNGNKTITTGGGGAIMTNSEALAHHARHLTTTARIRHEWEYSHDQVGYNYRMPNLNAAVGCAQLEQLPALLEAKRLLFERYRQAFARLSAVELVAEPPGCRSNYWLQTLRLRHGDRGQRDAILSATNAVGLNTRPVWTLLHTLPHFQQCPRMDLPVAEALEASVVNLPSSAHLVSLSEG